MGHPALPRDLGGLERVALRMTGTLELDEVLAAVTGGLVEDLGAALARVWLVAPGERELHLRASSGLSERLDGGHRRVPVGALKIGEIALSGRPVCTNRLEDDDRIVDKEWVRRHGLASFAGYPLAFRGEVLGVLAMFAARALSEREFERLALFAGQAAVAVANARLFAELEALRGRLQSENAYLHDELARDRGAGEILGRSPALLAALEKLDQVAPTASTVLLQGETGTGKELFAQALHARSPRRGRPLVEVSCAAISASLIESELFGHEKGAFTGALARRLGRFELASGGTLFLDEIGELPLEAQAKLLRVLQEREIERVGGAARIPVDVRLVTATNRDLQAEVERGRFRADLFYRLAVFPITVPPLRERRADIPLLAIAFAERQARILGKPLRGVAADALDRLAAYAFPGNVRELHNLVERAAILARGERIRLADLPDLGGAAPPAPGPAATLEDVERAHILRVLRDSGWIVEGAGGAAAALGQRPSTLRSRMAKLGIQRPRG